MRLGIVVALTFSACGPSRAAPVPSAAAEPTAPSRPTAPVHVQNGRHAFQVGPGAIEVRASAVGSDEEGYRSTIALAHGQQVVTLVDGEPTLGPADVFAWVDGDALILHFLPASGGEDDVFMRYQITGGALRQAGTFSMSTWHCVELDTQQEIDACSDAAYAAAPSWVAANRRRPE